MKSHEFIREDAAVNDYQQMLKFVSANRTPGVPPEQQVAVALFKELQNQQRQNQQMGAELAAAEQRIDVATQSGELSRQELGKHQGELEKERERGDKQKSAIGKLDQAHAEREKASAEQIQQLTSQLEMIKNKPGVSAEAGKELERQIEELKANSGNIDAGKLQELEQAVAAMQNMQQVDDGTMKNLVAQVQNAQAMADELARSKSSLGKDVEQTSAQLQTQLDQMKQQLAHFREVEQTVSALQPMVQDVLAPKVDKLYKRQLAVDRIDPAAIAKQFSTKQGLNQAVGQMTSQPAPPANPPVAEDKLFKLIKWATSK
jgi:chromosome segregation ATPase